MVQIRTGMGKRFEDREGASVLRWLGHIERMNEERLVKKVLQAKVRGRRPKFWWVDCVKRVREERRVWRNREFVHSIGRSECRMVVIRRFLTLPG